MRPVLLSGKKWLGCGLWLICITMAGQSLAALPDIDIIGPHSQSTVFIHDRQQVIKVTGAAQVLPDNTVRVTRQQNDVKGQFYDLQFTGGGGSGLFVNGPARDLRPYLEQSVLSFDLQTTETHQAAISISMACVSYCYPKMHLRQLAVHSRPASWQHVAIALRCLTDKNTDLSRVQRCLLYTSPSPRDRTRSRMPSSA